MHRGVFVDKNSGKKELLFRLGYEIHVESISISTDFVGHTQRETIFYTEQHCDI